MCGLYPRLFNSDLIFIAVGVFPLPPTVTFPIQITGTELFHGAENIMFSFIKIRQISVAGERK
jgi:hypothetical protein